MKLISIEIMQNILAMLFIIAISQQPWTLWLARVVV